MSAASSEAAASTSGSHPTQPPHASGAAPSVATVASASDASVAAGSGTSAAATESSAPSAVGAVTAADTTVHARPAVGAGAGAGACAGAGAGSDGDGTAVLDPESREVVDRLGLNTWTPQDREAYLEQQDSHPLFMEKAPTLEEAEKNEYVSAMQAMAYDDDETPEALAEVSKNKGNAAFKKGKAFHGNAMRHYKEAVDHCLRSKVQTEDMERLQSVVRANLAAILLVRERYNEVLHECDLALKLWPDNVKAGFRAARAAVAMGKMDAAATYVANALRVEPDNKPLLKLQSQVQAKLDAAARAKAATAAKRQARLDSIAAVRRECAARNVSVGFPAYKSMYPTDAVPFVDEVGALVFPVVFLYPEYSQSDFVERFSEVTTFRDQLETVLPDAGPPPAWDETHGSYRVSNVRVYLQTNASKPRPLDRVWRDDDDDDVEANYGRQQWFEVPLDAPLLLALVHPQYVLCDIPVFSVVAADSEWGAKLARQCAGRLVVPELPSAPA